ncbi:uncharacterized protein [Rutidosis leptorrhynchoides]|uniref:uncharacterized protein n=1 Tax=Rutidosis leptorrhynchoides TaxID=125765 RepID=UPI003A9A3DBE
MIWSDNRDLEERIWCRLDRALINVPGIDIYGGAVCRVLPVGISDHSSVIICLATFTRNKVGAFRFYDMWISHPNFKDIMAIAWKNTMPESPLFQFWHKLKAVKIALKQLNRWEFLAISDRMNQYRAMLEGIQLVLPGDLLNSVLLDEEKAVLDTLRSYWNRNKVFSDKRQGLIGCD